MGSDQHADQQIHGFDSSTQDLFQVQLHNAKLCCSRTPATSWAHLTAANLEVSATPGWWTSAPHSSQQQPALIFRDVGRLRRRIARARARRPRTA